MSRYRHNITLTDSGLDALVICQLGWGVPNDCQATSIIAAGLVFDGFQFLFLINYSHCPVITWTWCEMHAS